MCTSDLISVLTFPKELWLTSAQQTLKAATEPMFRQPPGLWGLFGFSNLLSYNKTTQVFPDHESKFLSLMTLHAGHSSEVLYMPPFLTTFTYIPRNAVADQGFVLSLPFQGPLWH